MKALFLLHYVISPLVEWIEQPPTPLHVNYKDKYHIIVLQVIL
jgi:hypothetical protein